MRGLFDCLLFEINCRYLILALNYFFALQLIILSIYQKKLIDQKLYTAARIALNADLDPSPELFLLKILSFALSSLNSGIKVNPPALMLPESVVANTLLPTLISYFASPKYSARKVSPNVSVAVRLAYKAEPHQLVDLDFPGPEKFSFLLN